MTSVIFMAPWADTVTVGNVYAAGHKVSLGEAVFRQLQADGKVAAQGPDPFNIRVSALGTTTASISFDVDRVMTSCGVLYGTTPALGSSLAISPAGAPASSLTGNLTGLTTGTTYYYQVNTGTIEGYATYSTTRTFRTL